MARAATPSRKEYRKGRQRAVHLTDEQWAKLERVFGHGMRNKAIQDWIDGLPEPQAPTEGEAG